MPRVEVSRRWSDYLVAAALVLVYLKNYWVSEDAYLNLRSVDQLLRGHGPIWNPHERVQVFTSPAWFWLQALSQLIVRESYLAVFLLSSACFGVTLVLLRKLAGSSAAFALAGLLLIGSNAAFDYASSGQENVLGYCLLLYHVRAYLAGALRPVIVSAGLLLVCRHDFAALIAPTVAYTCWTRRSTVSARDWLALVAIGVAPLAAWSLFSLFYYGSPLPNPAYAKLSTGFPRTVFLERGLDYLAVLLRYDVLSALCIAAGILTLALQQGLPYKCLGGALALHVAYVVYVGGDYMQGRFLSYAALVSIAMLSRFALDLPDATRGVRATVALALLGFALGYTRTPLNTSFAQPKDDSAIHAPGRDYVLDARGAFGVYTSLSSYLRASELSNYPEHPLAIAGRQFAQSDQKVAVIHAGGMFGWAAGTSKTVIEAHGIADPLLARLPASVFAGVGHYLRYRPEGYVDGMMRGAVQIEDVDLGAYYAKLALITQSPQLFTWERLETLVLLNAGHYDPLLSHFVGEKIQGKQVLPSDPRARRPGGE